MTYWTKMMDRINAWNKVPCEAWDIYQLLGYLLHQQGKELVPRDPAWIAGSSTQAAPSRHPQVEMMRAVFREFGGKPLEVKAYLDWCLVRYEDRFDYRGLIANIDRYLQSLHKPEELITKAAQCLTTAGNPFELQANNTFLIWKRDKSRKFEYDPITNVWTPFNRNGRKLKDYNCRDVIQLLEEYINAERPLAQASDFKPERMRWGNISGAF